MSAMEIAGPTPEEPRFRLRLALILGVHAILALSFLGKPTLWNIDEGRVAEVAREMARSGDWLTPRLGGNPFPAYPPLAYWLMSLSGSLLGFNEFSMRLPSALSGIALVGVIGLMARRLAGAKAGLLAALVLATFPGFFQQECMCRGDVLTTFLATCAFSRFLALADGKRSLWNFAGLYGCAALGVLGKGPIAIILLGLGVLGWIAVRRDWRVLGRLKLAWGFPAALALAAPWYVLVTLEQGSWFLRENLLLENVSAFAEGFQQRQPFWFYFPILPAMTVPWFLALAFSFKVRRDRGMDVASAWAAGVFLFLLVSSAKRQSYVTYLLPSLALWIGVTLAAVDTSAPRLLRRGLLGLSAALVAGGATLACIPRETWSSRAKLLADHVPVLAVAAAVTAAAVFLATRVKGPLAGCIALACGLGVGMAYYGATVNAQLDGQGPERSAFCRRIARAAPTGEGISVLGPEVFDGALHFYVGSTLPTRWGEPGLYVLTEEQVQRLRAAGKTVTLLDQVPDKKGRLTLFAKVSG